MAEKYEFNELIDRDNGEISFEVVKDGKVIADVCNNGKDMRVIVAELNALSTELAEAKAEVAEYEIRNDKLNDCVATALLRIAELERWVDDLQSGMYINCVYCGHRYGPKENTPTSMADVLKEHIEQCPKHPMSSLKAHTARLTEALGDVGLALEPLLDGTLDKNAEDIIKGVVDSTTALNGGEDA